MTILSPASLATSATATEGDVKSFLTNLRNVISEFLGTDSADHGAALATLGSLLCGSVAKTTSYTILPENRGRVIQFTGSGGVTLNIPACATLGDGFSFGVVNNSSGTVTIDPNLAETINGGVSHVVAPTETVIIYSDGSKWLLFGKAPASIVSTFNGRSGAVSLASSDVTGALGFYPSANGHSHPGVHAGMNAIVSISSAALGSGHVCTRADGSTFMFSTSSGAGG